ncbi:MAG: tetratricopeptide repeat protein [Chloroflexota bacterium]
MSTEQLSSSRLNSDGVSAAALETFKRGREAMRIQENRKAIRFFSDVLDFENLHKIFRARTLEYRGLCHWLLSEFDAAEADYRRSLDTSDDLEQKARARVRLGEVIDFQGNYDKATPIYYQALEEATQVQNLLVMGRAHRGLGVLNRRQGNTEKAVDHLNQALASFRQIGEAREQARVLTSLGRTRQARGEIQNALEAHEEALKIFISLEDRWRQIQVLNDIGEAHQALYDIEVAKDYHQQALNLANEVEAELLKPEIKRNLGVDLFEQGQTDEGMYYLQASLDGAREIGNREHEALSLYNLARAHIRQSNLEMADRLVLMLQNVADDLDADRYRALASFAKGELLFYQGEQETAVLQLNKAMLAAQTSLDRGVLWKLHATISHVINNPEIAAVHLTIAADFIRQTAEPLQDEALKQTFVQAAPVVAVLNAAGINPDKL